MKKFALGLLAALAVGLFANASTAEAGGYHHHHHHVCRPPIVVYPTYHPYFVRPYTFNPYGLYPQVLTPQPVFLYRGY